MNLIERILEEMQSDTEDPERKAARLAHDYACASDLDQRAMDRVVLGLCGFTLKTLIDGHETLSYNPYFKADGTLIEA